MGEPPPSKRIWGRLLSESPKISHIDFDGKVFEARIGDSLCHFSPIEGGGVQLTHLKIEEGNVKVNGKKYESGHVLVTSGDELIFGSSEYIFLQKFGTSSNLESTLKDGELAQSRREVFEKKLREKLFYPNDIDISFENFPFFISDTTKSFLISSTRLHLDEKFEKARKIAPKFVSEIQRILLLGPAAIYQEALTKAIAKHFDARLLVVDAPSLHSETTIKEVGSFKRTSRPKLAIVDRPFIKAGTRVRFCGGTKPSEPKSGRGTVLLSFEDNEFAKVGVKLDTPFPEGNDLGGLCAVGHGLFCSSLLLIVVETPHEGDDFANNLINEIFEFSSNESKTGSLVVFIKDIEKIVVGESNVLKDKVKNLPHNLVVIASHTTKLDKEKEIQPDRNHGESTSLITQEKPGRQTDGRKVDGSKVPSELMKQIISLFPNKLTILLPKDQASLSVWKEQLQHHIQTGNAQFNIDSIHSELEKSGLNCPDLETLYIKDQRLTTENVHKVFGWAISFSENCIQESKLMLSPDSMKYGHSILESIQGVEKNLNDSLKDVFTEDEFEAKVLADVIHPDEIGITFDNIGALESVKDSLKELVMLPLRRPELFIKGQLAKHCKGILLFGPPGTGKTMLAKAMATEAGANFINVTLSDVTSKWFGEAEKYVKAIFSIANKVSPSIIFIDEVESLLGRRGSSTNDVVYNKMKTEFFIHWDGLRTKEGNRVLVLAATNRPFDLDEAVIRRLPRRFMVHLPDSSNREKILRIILADERLSADVDLKAMADRTNGYSGSDLKNLCEAAAHCPIRDLLEREKKERSSAIVKNKALPELCSSADIRPLKMEDLLYAQKQVRASVQPDSSLMRELVEWDQHFGEGGNGSQNNMHLSYFV